MLEKAHRCPKKLKKYEKLNYAQECPKSLKHTQKAPELSKKLNYALKCLKKFKKDLKVFRKALGGSNKAQ